MRSPFFLILGLMLSWTAHSQSPEPFHMPVNYRCHKTVDSIQVDGSLDEISWVNASWSHLFVDIEGAKGPLPSQDTRVKMLWDETYLYVAAELREKQIWATLTKKDAIIYRDNDFEVFLDPQGIGVNYMEIEINAMNTVMDLFLEKPYNKGGKADLSWDIKGLRTAVRLYGTLNDPSDLDSMWTVEMAIPIDELVGEQSYLKPEHGDSWRINFSRVQWDVMTVDGKYEKQVDQKGKTRSEHNWVWSPQHVINMHYPEMWGYLQFDDSPVLEPNNEEFHVPERGFETMVLRQLYFRQKYYHQKHGMYAKDIKDLVKGDIMIGDHTVRVMMEVDEEGYSMECWDPGGQFLFVIDQTGKTKSYQAPR